MRERQLSTHLSRHTRSAGYYHLPAVSTCSLERSTSFSRGELNCGSDYVAVASASIHQINHGTLAEWLTRCPAKAIPSGACVRITQVSRFSFTFLSSYSTSWCKILGSLFWPWPFDSHSGTQSGVQIRSDRPGSNLVHSSRRSLSSGAECFVKRKGQPRHVRLIDGLITVSLLLWEEDVTALAGHRISQSKTVKSNISRGQQCSEHVSVPC